MSSSESEEFESADEDFQENQNEKLNSSQNENRKSQKIIKELDKDDVNKNRSNQTEVNQVDKINLTIQSKQEKIDRNQCVSPPKRVECWEGNFTKNVPLVDKTTKDETSDANTVPIKEDEENKKEENQQEKQQLQESEDKDDGWEIDDWGDEIDNNEDKTNESKISSKEKTPLAEDGWGDDWNDWGGTETPLKKLSSQNSQHIKNVAPKNLNSTKPNQNASNYDVFPILNDLSPNKRLNINVLDQQERSEIIPDDLQKNDAGASYWGGWKPWGGVASLISTATEGVTSLTSHVSQGFSSVIENSIGVPDPEELARLQKKNMKEVSDEMTSPQEFKQKESPEEDRFRQSFGSIVSGVTNIGNKVIAGGLDTLEGIGKKTMTILQENDPLLLNKRKFLGLDSEKPNLSQILREAKEKTEETENHLKQIQKHLYKKQLHFETLFDHYHGLVHLEALEMLSKQSSLKLQSLLEPLAGRQLTDLEETLNEVKELCELNDIENDESDGTHSVDELTEKYLTAIEELGVEVDFSDIFNCWRENTNWLDSSPNAEPQDIYDKALRCLAQTSAIAVHKMHKIAEMLLIKDHHSTANEADSLVQLTTTCCWHLSGIANRFGGKLNKFESSEEISSLITSIFLEVTNSTSYIQSAFQLFIPILQIGAA